MRNSHDQLPPDLVDVVPRIVDALRGEAAVCLSDGDRFAVIASAVAGGENTAWTQYQNGTPGALLLRDAAAAMDFIVEPTPLARRLMRKCWPGDVQLVFANGIDRQLLEQFPPEVQGTVEGEQGVSLGVPDSPLLRDILNRVEFPLVKLPIGATPNQESGGLTVLPADAESLNAATEIRVVGDRWELMNAAGLTPEEVSHMLVERILFVCTGNTCRSPMAEGVFRHMLAERLNCAEADLEQQGFYIASAGLSAAAGSPASPESVELCRSCGVDLTGHSSQPLTESLLLESDRIYTMTAGHRDAIVQNYPDLADGVRLLSPHDEDVSDPMGWGIAAYEQSLREIAENVHLIVEELAGSR